MEKCAFRHLVFFTLAAVVVVVIIVFQTPYARTLLLLQQFLDSFVRSTYCRFYAVLRAMIFLAEFFFCI